MTLDSGEKRSRWLLFFIPSFIWGTTWLMIKFQLGQVAPEVSVVYRFGLASALLFGWCALRGIGLRFDGRTHAKLMLLGLLQYGFNYVFVYLSEKYLTSGLVAVVFVLLLVWNLIGARLFFRTPVGAAVIAGAALGMLGVALVFWPEVSELRGAQGSGLGLLLAVLSTLVASGGNLWSQRIYAQGVSLVPSTAWAMLYAALAVAGYCALRGIPFTFEASLPYLASLSYLALFGSVFAFISYLTLIQRVGAGPAGYTTAATPVVAMATSALFEGYRWTAAAAAGMALVVAGNVLVLQGKRQASRS